MGSRKKNQTFSGVLTFCHTKTLWTMAHPQNTMPRPMKTDVTIAGVEWNWMNVYKIMPVNRNMFGCYDGFSRVPRALGARPAPYNSIIKKKTICSYRLRRQGC